MLNSVNNSFANVEQGLQEEYLRLAREISHHDTGIGETADFDENIKELDMYAEYLGADYQKMKDDFKKAIGIIDQTCQLKWERLALNEPVTQQQVDQVFGDKQQEAMVRIHNDYIMAGQNRK